MHRGFLVAAASPLRFLLEAVLVGSHRPRLPSLHPGGQNVRHVTLEPIRPNVCNRHCINQLPRDANLSPRLAGGAGNWHPDLNQYFKGKDIFILPDHDERERSMPATSTKTLRASRRECRAEVRQLRSSLFWMGGGRSQYFY